MGENFGTAVVGRCWDFRPPLDDELCAPHRPVSAWRSANGVFSRVGLRGTATAMIVGYVFPALVWRVVLTPGAVSKLRFTGPRGVSLSQEPQVLEVSLVRRSGAAAPTGHYLVELLPHDSIITVPEIFATSGAQSVPVAGSAALERGDLLGVASPSSSVTKCLSLAKIGEEGRKKKERKK